MNKQMNLNIRPEDAKPVSCENCGGQFFKQSVMLRKIAKLLVGTDQDMLVPVPVFRCDDCGYVNEEFIPKEKSAKKDDTGNNKSGLII